MDTSDDALSEAMRDTEPSAGGLPGGPVPAGDARLDMRMRRRRPQLVMHHGMRHTATTGAGRHDTVIAIMHPWMLLGAFAALAALLTQTIFRWHTMGPEDWAMLAAIAIATAALPAWPHRGSWWLLTIGALASAATLLPGIGAPFLTTTAQLAPVSLLPMGLAAATAAYCHPWPWPLASGALFATGTVTIWRRIASVAGIGTPWWTAAAMAVLTGAALAALGAVAGAHRHSAEQDDERARLATQLRLLRHGNQLAIELHDTLSNDLTFISTIARQHDGDQDDPHRDDWSLVLARSQQAFAEVHGIIRFLSGTTASPTVTESPDTDLPERSGRRTGAGPSTAQPSRSGCRPCDGSSPQQPAASAFDRIGEQVRGTHRFLERLGYRGRAGVSGIAMAVTPQAEREALSLIREIGTNISRHAAPGDDAYLLHVSFSPDRIEIRQTNDMPGAGAAPRLSDAERSGQGLAMHRQRIVELGGVCHTRADEDGWMIYARIPCRAV